MERINTRLHPTERIISKHGNRFEEIRDQKKLRKMLDWDLKQKKEKWNEIEIKVGNPKLDLVRVPEGDDI